MAVINDEVKLLLGTPKLQVFIQFKESFFKPPPVKKGKALTANPPRIYGINLLIDDERSDLVFYYFLCGNDFSVTKSLKSLQKTLDWRLSIDGLEKDLGEEELGLVKESLIFQGRGKGGSIVCYNLMSKGHIEKHDDFGPGAYKALMSIVFRAKICLFEKMISQILRANQEERGSMNFILVNDLAGPSAFNKSKNREAWKFINTINDHYPCVYKQTKEHELVQVCWSFRNCRLSFQLSIFLQRRLRFHMVASLHSLLKVILISPSRQSMSNRRHIWRFRCPLLRIARLRGSLELLVGV